MQKSLDQKLARILADPSCRDFIIADAKDADMAFGLSAPGQSPEYYAGEAQFRTLDEYRQLMRDIVRQGLVDIMLMSASSNELLTIQERLFDDSHITPAVRANDTTDIWLASGTGRYGTQSSQPFRTATIDHIMCGKAECGPAERKMGADLGLYSITYNNDVHLDRPALLAYSEFRLEAEKKGFRHFLEVFAPNNCHGFDPKDVGRFVNDNIVRTLAGVTSRGRPVFLKIPYFGPEAMEKAGRLRQFAGGRHPRRIERDDVRRLQPDLSGEETRGARRPLRTQNQQLRAPTQLRQTTPSGRRRRSPTGRSGSRLPRRPCKPWASSRIAGWRTT